MAIGKIDPAFVDKKIPEVRLAASGGFSGPPEPPNVPVIPIVDQPLLYEGLDTLKADLDRFFISNRPSEHIARAIGVTPERYGEIIWGSSALEPAEAVLFANFLGRNDSDHYLKGVPAPTEPAETSRTSATLLSFKR